MADPNPDPLGAVASSLAAVRALRDHADRLEEASVSDALAEGWSWPQIAEALDVTRQAVHKKFSRRFNADGSPRRVGGS
jgi:DNA-binding NarL/FixJ family response regulator